MDLTRDQKIALELIEKLKQDAINKTQATQVKEIIPIENWVENKYYVGESGLKLYPFWKEQLCDIFSEKRAKYNEIILEAALGVGKTTVANFMMIRKLYELSCYTNVQAMYNLMASSTIYLMYFTLTLSSAKNTGFDQFKDTIDSIPYFQKEFPRNEKNNTVLEYPGNIKVTYGSNVGHQIGMNLIMGMLDEANFHEGAENSAKAAQQSMQALSGVMNLYNSIVNRGGSRFIRDGKNDSMMILISSPRASSSITQTRIDQIGDSDTTKIIHCRKWDVAPKNYKKDRFWVFLGNSRLDPFIVETVEDLDRIINSEGLPIRTTEGIEETIKGFDRSLRDCFDDVPVELKKQYETSIINAIQDISGKTTAPTGRLFTSRKIFNDCISEELPNVFWRDTFTISTGDDSETNSIEHFFKGPFLNPSLPRFLHIDQSLATDCTGMACTYPGKPMVLDGEQVPTFNIEFALRIVPPSRPNRISISKVRAFIYYMHRVANLNIGKVTYDTFQCLDGKTIVSTPKGDIPLENIDVGSEVYTPDGIRKVTSKFKYDNAETMRVDFTNGVYLIGTPNHRIMALRDNKLDYVEFRSLVPGDLVVTRYSKCYVAKKTSNSEPGTVYDLEIEKNHCYYANGILSHNSAEALEDLKRNGINTANLSVDRTDEQYITFIDLLQQNRLRFSNQVAALMSTELFDLNHYREKGKVDHLPNKCLVGSTEILLGNGKTMKIEKMCGMTNVPVFGCEMDKRTRSLRIVPTVATKVWKTKEESKLCRIYLSNGSTIECTRDHRIMLEGGLYRRAEKLVCGDKLSTCKYGSKRVLGDDMYLILTVSVDKVELYETETPVPVYDMCVPSTHNFALGNSVIVHNSKDVMDAVVGSVWNALKSDSSMSLSGKDLYDTMSAALKDDSDFGFDELLREYGIMLNN